MRKVIIASLIFFSVFTSFLVVNTYAQTCSDYSCTDCENPKVDLVCQQRRLIDPSDTSCTLMYCADGGNKPTTETPDVLNLNFFGVTIRLNSDQALASVLYLIFSFILAIALIATVFLGVLAAVNRARAEKDEDIAKAQKTMTNAITGFVLFGVSLVIVQIVATVIGVGSIFDMVKFPSGLLTDTTDYGTLATCIQSCNDDEDARSACESNTAIARAECLAELNAVRTQCINACQNQYE